MAEELRPIRLKYEDGAEYVLEFNAETVRATERAGFSLSEAADKPMTMIPLLFFFAFKMHHPTMKREKADEILYKDLGGLSDKLQERLVDLYLAPINALGGEETPKNVNLTVEF